MSSLLTLHLLFQLDGSLALHSWKMLSLLGSGLMQACCGLLLALLEATAAMCCPAGTPTLL